MISFMNMCPLGKMASKVRPLVPIFSISFLQWTRNAAVTAVTPEVDGHQEARNQRQANAVQNVEPEQRALSDKPAAKQRESRVALIVDQRYIAQFEQCGSRSFISGEGCCSSHVTADGDSP